MRKLLNAHLREQQKEMLRALKELRFSYFVRYIKYIERKGMEETDFSFYEYLLLEEKREQGRYRI